LLLAAKWKDFEKLDFTTWTLRRAFCANMGGLMLEAPDYQAFPINASHLCYLVENKYLDFSQETIAMIQKDIRDKNKSNGSTHFITVIQVGWFVLHFFWPRHPRSCLYYL